MHHLLTPLTLLLTPFPAPALAQQQRCQWATLRSATDSILETLRTGLSSATTTPVVFSSAELVYTLNGTPLPLPLPLPVPASAGSVRRNSNTTGLWVAPLDVSVAHSVVDQDRCAAFIKVVGYPATFDTNTKPEVTEGVLVVGAQVFYNYTAREGATVRRLDMIVTAEGDWNMPVGLDGEVLARLIKGEDWGALSRASQDGREVLESVAGSYLDRLGGNANGTEGVEVAWGRPCARLEGNVYMVVGDAESCEIGLEVTGGGEEGKGVTKRQFVVDESVGSVSVLARDGRLGNAPTVFEFRVVKGALRYVHQFTATASTETSN